MSISNLTKTSFGSTPTSGTEVIDIYKSEEFTKLMATNNTGAISSELLSDIFPDFPQDKIVGYLSDSSLSEYLTSSNTTLKDAWSDLGSDMPRGVDKSALLNAIDLGIAGSELDTNGKDLGLTELFKWSGELKDSLNITIFNSLTTGKYASFMRNAKLFKDTFDPKNEELAKVLAKVWAKSSGKDSDGDETSTVLKGSNTLTIATELIETGETDGLSEWLDTETEGMTEREEIYANLIPVAAKANEWVLMADFIDKAGGRFTSALRNRTICSILFNYEIPDVDKTPEEKGLDLLTQLDLIDNQWDKGVRGVDEVCALDKFLFANNDALNVLSYTVRCAESALIAKHTSLSVKSYGSLMKNEYPALMLS